MEAIAEVNHGRWIVRCPLCPAAYELRSPELLCANCGAHVPVRMPKEWREIDAILMQRPVEKRNWLPGESLLQLQAENLEHGVPV